MGEIKSTKQPPGMNLIYLPYADDIRTLQIEGQEDMKHCDVDSKEENDLITKAERVLTGDSRTGDGILLEGMMEPTNPALQKHYDALEALALAIGNDDGMDMDNQSDDDDEFVDEIAMNDAGMLHAAETEIDAFIASLELTAGPMEVAAPASRKRKAAGGADAG